MDLKIPMSSASLSTSAESRWKYEVFLSYSRGAGDTVPDFTSYLHSELQKREMPAFMDLEIGEEISPHILEAIQESRFAIVILSKNYASSACCLDELAQIFQCMELKETILPVFYHVEPYIVRYQRGVYTDAFANHQERFKDQPDRLMKWREALSKISGISGWDIRASESERQLVNQIVEFICNKPTEIESTEDIERRQATDGTSPRWKHDVFINFRGRDTRKGFLSHLYDELQNTANLKIVRDDAPLTKGRNIALYLLKAIEESRFAIIVLSQHFASSTFCLDELAKIYECMGEQNRILPIFYHVEPSDVRRQMGSFKEAFTKHEARFQHQEEKLRRWRHVLTMVANLSGFMSSQYKYEGDLIKDVVKEVCSKLVQSTVSTENSEATGDAMVDRTSSFEAAPLWKNDVLSGFGIEDPRRGFVTHSDHKLQNKGVSETLRDEEQLDKGLVDPSISLSSSAHKPAPEMKYDVFLSFRGDDTRRGFVAHLYHELQNSRVIKTFKDDVQLQKGTVISSNILTAIEESRFAIVVLSENYASSSWCLDELAKIFQCMKDKNTIFPIFYEVEPTDVRHQKTDTNFGKAFIKLQETHGQNNEKMKQWRDALEEVAGLAGWHSNKYLTDIELIQDIVKHLWKKVLQTPTGNFRTFEATRQAMDEVMKVLKDGEVTVLGVHGMAGVGKTTMVKHVGAQAQKDGLFDHVVTIVISKCPDYQEIEGSLADSMGLTEGIMSGDRMLIILDDIWESFELSSIGIPSHHELQKCNSKVVLTTRESNVCHSMGCHAQIHLNVLSYEDSWKLLKQTSGNSFDESNNSNDDERKVAQECRGLPRAIKAAAKSLGDKYLNEWNEAVARAFGGLDEWNEAAQAFNLEAEEGAFHSLEDAYDSLESDDAKSCFLLCCLFPKNYDIPIEELLKYGMGIGLFQYDTMQEARDRAHFVVKYLKASRLLLEGTKKGCIWMTDHNRNLARSIVLAEEGSDGILVKPGLELEEWPEGWWQGWTRTYSWLWDQPHEGYSIISLMRNNLHKLPEYLVCSKLQILLLQNNAGICDIPETFLQSPNALRVFDLSFTSISSLPPSFSFLTSLQALNLDFCKNLSNISVLGKIKKLEILSMRELPLKIFPEQIGDLTSLRMLDVTGRYLERIPSKVISRLYRLEELRMKFQFGTWGSKIEDAVEETNADFVELTGLLDLNILEVYISDATCLPQNVDFKPNWVEFDICISRHVPDMLLRQQDVFSRTLTLDTTINSLPDWFVSVVTAKVEKLEYTNCDDLTDLVAEYDHGRLFVLKYLSVKGYHKKLKEIINTMRLVSNKPVFENLEELHLHCLYSLEELCLGELPPKSLRKLKLLKVQTCHSLVNALLPLTLLPRLQNLENIICVHLDRMKYVFGSDEGVVDPEKIFLRNLREMRLCALDKLVSICNGPARHAIFQNLKILAICECKELKSLFTINVAECLLQLEDLCIEHCSSLDRVIEASNSLSSEITLPALKRLALIDLPVLTRFCTESGSMETQCPSLVYLYVENCIKFSYYENYHFSKKQIHFNDQYHLSSLAKRWKEMHNRL